MQEIKRILEVDAIRGLAIVLMIFYHFLFDLNYFGLVTIPLWSLPMVIFQRMIAILFVVVVGTSLVLSEMHNKKGYITHLWRGFKLTNFAILITAVTWIYPHEGFVTFGIIHMIALSTFIAPFFFKLKKWNFLIGTVIIVTGSWLNLQQTNSEFLFPVGLVNPDYIALDYYPMLPWFGVVLIGMATCNIIYPNGITRFNSDTNKLIRKLAFLGKNSLMIYLVHQIILISLIIIYLAVR